MTRTLLPSVYIKAIRREKIIRLVIVFFVLIWTVLFVGVIFMLPSYFMLALQKDAIFNRLHSSQESSVRRDINELEKEISDSNQLIAAYVNSDKKKHSLSAILERISEVTPLSITLSSIDFQRGDNNRFRISLRGVARTRKDLIGYGDALRKTREFESINSPLTNILQGTNISFNIDFVVKEEYYSI